MTPPSKTNLFLRLENRDSGRRPKKTISQVITRLDEELPFIVIAGDSEGGGLYGLGPSSGYPVCGELP
jgi:hypothetical protein